MSDTQNNPGRTEAFSISGLIVRNLKYYWRSNLAVILGTAVSVAALTGSLIVGDSGRGTLRELAVERLGRVKYAVSTPQFFREELANDFIAETRMTQGAMEAVSALMTKGAVQSLETELSVPDVHVLGVTDAFFRLSPGGPFELPEGQRIAVNSQLAEDLGLSVGDSILVTLGRQTAAPADSIFAHRGRDATLTSMRLTVQTIIPSNGIGVFGLAPGRGTPRNIYIALDALQQRLDAQGKANILLVASSDDSQPNAQAVQESLLGALLMPDYGLHIVPNAAHGYLSLESDRLIVPVPVIEHAGETANGLGMKTEASSIYMANAIVRRAADGSRKEIPYSVIGSIPRHETPPFGPLPASSSDRFGDFDWRGEGLLNAWAADDLGAYVGDEIELTYFAADQNDHLKTRSLTFTLKGVVAMEGPGNDPGVVPSLKGVTDVDTMESWDPPFPIDLDRIRPKDEAYWDAHRTTPKVFLHPRLVRYLWDSSEAATRVGEDGSDRLDWTTSVMIAPSADTDLTLALERFRGEFLKQADPERFGLRIEPVAEQALRAAKGSSDFGTLFLSMSLFVVLAAAGLVGLFFRLTVEQRASQHGIMMATGFKAGRVRKVLMGEGTLLAVIGVALGVPLGVGYAALIALGLRTLWRDVAGGLPFSLHVTPASLIVGGLIGFVVASAALRWALRLLKLRAVLGTLLGWRALEVLPTARIRIRSMPLCIISALAGGALLALGLLSVLPLQITFFASGGLLMVALLSLFHARLQRVGKGRAGESVSLWKLGLRGAARSRLRSIVTTGSMACACFILVTVAANQRDLTQLDVHSQDSGSGGFSLLARATTPIRKNLNLQESWADSALPPESLRLLEGVRLHGFAVNDGDDVSCLNVQKPQQPTILGAPDEIIERDAFHFAATLPIAKSADGLDGWQLLKQELDAGERRVIPAIADAASAQWILRVGLGDEVEVTDRHGNPLYLRLVGLLSNSIFQSEMLVSEENFRRNFERDAGDGYYLIATQPGEEDEVAKALRHGLAEHGFDVKRTADVLAEYAEVQNTYLSTFQTLGGIGLLLGTFGIVAVLLRNVVERRAELAMLLALGFRRGRVVRLMLAENGLLLLMGTVVGSAAALTAVAPHMMSAVADVNWISLAATVFACLASGLLSCYVAAAVSVRKDLLSALRSE